MNGKQEHLMEPTAQTMTYGGGGTAVLAGLSLNELGVVIGILVGLAGLALQVWLGLRRDKREQELHRRRLEDQ